MKFVPLKMGTVALAAAAALFVSPTKVSAAAVYVQIGAPPPPPVVVEQPWAPPYRTAIWIKPHYEVINGRWVWVRGYYTYPPRSGVVWVNGYYRHGYYHPGYWR